MDSYEFLKRQRERIEAANQQSKGNPSEQEKAKQWLEVELGARGPFGLSGKALNGEHVVLLLASYASSQLSSKEAELAELKADIELLQAAPLCGNHAQVWYTMRSTIETKIGCVQCDALSELTLLREQVERLTDRAKAAEAELSEWRNPAARGIRSSPSPSTTQEK